MKKIFLTFVISVICLFCQSITSQNTQEIALHFAPVFEMKPLVLEKKYTSDEFPKNISFTLFKCYVSHFEFYKNQKLIYSDDTETFLLDSANLNSLNRKIAVPVNSDFDEIRFYFGIDDKTNDKGISGDDLDPTKGMYWTWQTGYINMKLEGYSESSSTTDHSFQFHLGGFIAPYISFQPIALKSVTKNEITVYIEIADFINKINLADTPTLMSPGDRAVALSKNAALMFHL